MLSEHDTKLAKRKNGYYEIRWTEWDDTLDRAVTRTHSCRTKDIGAASAYRRTWLEAERLVSAMSVGKTIGDLCELYLTEYADPKGVVRSQRFALVAICRAFGNDVVGNLTSAAFARFTSSRVSVGGVVPATVRRELSALGAVLRWATRVGYLPRDTVLPYIEKPADSAPRTRYMTEREAEDLWDRAVARLKHPSARWNTRRIGLWVCLAMETAARSSAVEGLTWDRIQLGRGVIDFREPGRRVSKKRRVSVPVSDKLLPILEWAYADEAEARALKGLKMDDSGPVLRVFGSTRKAFETLALEGGFENLTRHDLRRTWATLRAQRGVSLFDIAGVLGDTYETVAKHYAHHAPDHLRSAVNS